MENSQAILDTLNNIIYYTKKIRDLCSGQFDIDFSKVIEEEVLSKRTTALRRIWSEAADIDAHCIVIQKNLEAVDDRVRGKVAGEAN